jgi:hypothetical protein
MSYALPHHQYFYSSWTDLAAIVLLQSFNWLDNDASLGLFATGY